MEKLYRVARHIHRQYDMPIYVCTDIQMLSNGHSCNYVLGSINGDPGFNGRNVKTSTVIEMHESAYKELRVHIYAIKTRNSWYIREL